MPVTQKPLKTASAESDSVFKYAPEPVILTDTTGKCINVNDATCKLLGYEKDELEGRMLVDLVEPSEAHRLIRLHSSSSPKTLHRTEIPFIQKSGDAICVEISSSKLPNGQNLVFLHDISERNKTEDALLTSEERFRTLIEKSHDAIALINSGGDFEYMSPGAKKILGFKPEELVGKNCFEFTHPDELAELSEVFSLILKKAGSSATREHKYKHKNGTYVWLQTTVTNLLEDKNVRAIVSNFSDITERKLSENELAYQTELLKAVTDTTTLGLFMMNDQQKCTYMNEIAEKMTGYSFQEIQEKPLHEYIHYLKPDGSKYPINECPLDRALPERRVYDGEELFLTKTGNFFPVRFSASPLVKNGKPYGTVIEIQDISKEKEAQSKIIESKERFRQLADSMPQIVWSAYSKDGSEYFNERWYQYTGFPKKEKHEWREIIHPEDYRQFEASWRHSLETGKPFAMEFRLREKGRLPKYRWFLCRAVPIRDEKGTVIRWYGTCTDIDDVRSALEQNLKLEQKAFQLTEQKDALLALNKAKDDFISLASHQLRTPATAVKAYTGMLMEGYAGELTKSQAKFLKQAYESNERQLQTIDDLLNVAQIDTGQFTLNKQEADIIKLMQDVIDEQRDKYQKREQSVTFESSHISLLALIDKARLRMVFENLIDNASKYTPEGKNVSVTIKSLGEESVHITIADEGVGIEKKDMDRLFQKFSRIRNLLSEAVGGTGLGLYWAKKIVDLHGGTIFVESQKDKGTTFMISLPLNTTL